jgi:hypothetical protein
VSAATIPDPTHGSPETKLLARVLVLPLAIVSIAYWVWASAFSLSTLWGWYLVPLGLPPVTKLTACGIILVRDVIAMKPEDKQESKSPAWFYGTLILKPWWFLALGWFLLRFFS